MEDKQSNECIQGPIRLVPAFDLTDLGIVNSNFCSAVVSFSDRGEPVQVETSPAGRDARVTDGAPLRILIVDDDGLILMNSVDMLEDLGYSVTSANSGAMALEILDANLMYDLLITDFSMPKMNGLQLAMAVRAILPNLPILLATGYAELPAISDLVLPHLSKPYLQSDLQRAVTDLLGQTGAQ